MTNVQNINFDVQELTIRNDKWVVDLRYKKTDLPNFQLEIISTHDNKTQQNYLNLDFEGGGYLHVADSCDNSQSVKLVGNNLIISFGCTFYSYNLNRQEINWKTKPDDFHLFEFYDLEGDYLLRGELQIHRINNNGSVLWSYGGCDVWVNIDGEKEVDILEDKIRLTDFAGNIYLIDYNGEILEFLPKN